MASRGQPCNAGAPRLVPASLHSSGRQPSLPEAPVTEEGMEATPRKRTHTPGRQDWNMGSPFSLLANLTYSDNDSESELSVQEVTGGEGWGGGGGPATRVQMEPRSASRGFAADFPLAGMLRTESYISCPTGEGWTQLGLGIRAEVTAQLSRGPNLISLTGTFYK